MGEGAQESEEIDSGDFQKLVSDYPSPRASKPGRRQSQKEAPPLGPQLAKTIQHFLPGLLGLLRRLPDPRRGGQWYYPKEMLVWSAMAIFLLTLRSRRQFRLEYNGGAFVTNLNALARSGVESRPHDDTIVHYLKMVEPKHFESLPVYIVRRLIRMKALDHWRVWGAFLVAVDGTGQLFFRQRHCPHCLSQKGSDGRLLFFHQVLEAKLVTASGLVFSIATEFIENPQPNARKQDCELSALPRLAAKLKANFPRLPIILLGDSLFCCKRVFDLCEKYRWHYIFTFKRKRMPALFAEFESLRNLTPRNRLTRRDGNVIQNLAWVNDLLYEGHILSAFECREEGPAGKHYFAWISDLPMACSSVVTASNQGGRLRWKLENEGFNNQKNQGYELEHAYCSDPWVAKTFYYLLQAVHAIHQLVTKGSLLRPFRKLFGSFRNFLRQLAQSFTQFVIAPHHWDLNAARSIQIRLDSS